MCFRVSSLIVFLFAAELAFPQSVAPTTAGQPSIQELLERIEQLERRVSELEHNQGSKIMAAQPSSAGQQAAATPIAHSSAPAVSSIHDQMMGTTATVQEAEVHYPNLQIRGFGDVDFSGTDQKGSISGFNLGQFVLHFASALSNKVNYFGEVSFTAQPTNYELAVERTIIRYDFNDYFKVSFGKYHTPIGYWNTAFHHGAWLQTSISRPEMVKFGGTLIPIHFLGAQVEGNIPSGGLGLGYSLGLGNGRGSPFSKAGDSGDVNNNRAWVANVFARPARLYGLQVGGSFYKDKLSTAPGTYFDEWIAAGDVVWTKEHPEILAEYANVHHRDLLTSQVFNTTSYYAQVGYRLPWQENKWKPYYRFEYIHRPTTEPIWDVSDIPSVVDLVGSTVGVRYDITNYAAFKGEYRNFKHSVNEPNVNGAFFQTAFTF
ncbi:MAG TPA: porin [Candidatus Sulfotelmatobacter sp.]|nr:porin [Candidatus Sulfotelmatobacter sp.]